MFQHREFGWLTKREYEDLFTSVIQLCDRHFDAETSVQEAVVPPLARLFYFNLNGKPVDMWWDQLIALRNQCHRFGIHWGLNEGGPRSTWATRTPASLRDMFSRMADGMGVDAKPWILTIEKYAATLELPAQQTQGSARRPPGENADCVTSADLDARLYALEKAILEVTQEEIDSLKSDLARLRSDLQSMAAHLGRLDANAVRPGPYQRVEDSEPLEGAEALGE